MINWNNTVNGTVNSLTSQSPSMTTRITGNSGPSWGSWKIVAHDLSNVVFTGYDQNMNPTTNPR